MIKFLPASGLAQALETKTQDFCFLDEALGFQLFNKIDLAFGFYTLL